MFPVCETQKHWGNMRPPWMFLQKCLLVLSTFIETNQLEYSPRWQGNPTWNISLVKAGYLQPTDSREAKWSNFVANGIWFFPLREKKKKEFRPAAWISSEITTKLKKHETFTQGNFLFVWPGSTEFNAVSTYAWFNFDWDGVPNSF